MLADVIARIEAALKKCKHSRDVLAFASDDLRTILAALKAAQAERDALRKAVEFAGYMANNAEQFIEAALAMVNEYHAADDKGCDPDIGPLAPAFDDHMRGLRSCVYEYRKRAALSRAEQQK